MHKVVLYFVAPAQAVLFLVLHRMIHVQELQNAMFSYCSARGAGPTNQVRVGCSWADRQSHDRTILQVLEGVHPGDGRAQVQEAHWGWWAQRIAGSVSGQCQPPPMGAASRKARALWFAVRPWQCDPYLVQETKVLKKFDRVRVRVGGGQLVLQQRGVAPRLAPHPHVRRC